jgi:outer membrane protein
LRAKSKEAAANDRHRSSSPIFVWLVAAGLAAAAPACGAEGLTLDDYFNAALNRSEVVASQAESIRQAEEHYKQATSTLLPTVNGVASYTWQEPLSVSTPTTSTNFLSYQPLAKLTATQPLFRGFREFAALRQTEALVSAQNDDYLNARIQLFRDVVQSFYNVLAIEQDLRNYDAEIQQGLERIEELNARVRIGRSRISEVLTVQSSIDALRAQVEFLKGQLKVARETFAFLSGLDSATTLNDTEPLPDKLEPVEFYLGRIPLRPDMKASQKRLAAARENVSVARGAHLPSVDLNGNYYLDRPGALKDINWDVQIALTVPIYAGGLLNSKTREALSQSNQAELTESQVSRQAEQEIRSLYQSVVHDLAQLAALQKATDAARANYTAQQRDYRLGLVTNLDVLQALTASQEDQRALDRVRYTVKLDYQTLQASAVLRTGLLSGATP